MFRHHTSQYPSCASEIHKTLCYFFAALNIFLALDLLADFSDGLFDMFEGDQSREHFDDEAGGDTIRSMTFGLIVGPAIANIILALLLIVGVYKRRPTFIRVFKLFILGQMAVLCVVSIFSYDIVLVHEGSYTIMLLVLAISVALFGTEAWIAGDYHKLLLEEIRVENFEPTTSRIV